MIDDRDFLQHHEWREITVHGAVFQRWLDRRVAMFVVPWSSEDALLMRGALRSAVPEHDIYGRDVSSFEVKHEPFSDDAFGLRLWLRDDTYCYKATSPFKTPSFLGDLSLGTVGTLTLKYRPYTIYKDSNRGVMVRFVKFDAQNVEMSGIWDGSSWTAHSYWPIAPPPPPLVRSKRIGDTRGTVMSD